MMRHCNARSTQLSPYVQTAVLRDQMRWQLLAPSGTAGTTVALDAMQCTAYLAAKGVLSVEAARSSVQSGAGASLGSMGLLIRTRW
jgi:hypothetical protein